MLIRNEDKDKVLAEDAELRVSTIGKAVGMMFRKEAKPMIFLFRVSRKVNLHMFFVFCTIDVLFLNDEKEVVEIKKSFKPFSTYRSNKKCRFVLELPEGVIDETETEVGDLLDFRKDI